MIPRRGSYSGTDRPKRFMSDLGSSLVKCSQNRAQMLDLHGPSAGTPCALLMGDIADSQGMNFEHSEMSSKAAARLSELSGHYFGTGRRVFDDESQQFNPHRVRKNRRESVQVVAVLLILGHGWVEPLRSLSGSELMVHLK